MMEEARGEMMKCSDMVIWPSAAPAAAQFKSSFGLLSGGEWSFWVSRAREECSVRQQC